MLELFYEVRKHIRKDENYVPRQYETIGGMWTVDTWKKNGIIFQIMDEGYTNRIFSKELGLDVLETMHGITWKKGDIETLKQALIIVNEGG